MILTQGSLKKQLLYELMNNLLFPFSGEDGPSQMALEDLAMFRAVQNCVVFYPSDAVSCERAVEIAANTPSMVYIRSSRPATATLYANDEKFEIGKSKVRICFYASSILRN